MPDRNRYLVPGLKQGIEILRLFSQARPIWSAPEVARQIKRPRATVYRLLVTLESLDLLERTAETGHEFRLGPGILALGFEFLSGLDLVEVARPLLQRLRDETNCSAHLAIHERGDVLYVARHPGPGVITANIGVGTRLPAYALGLGRLFLMDLEPAAIQALYRSKAFKRFTAETPPNLEALSALLAKDRRRGYVISRSFFAPGIVAICAPIRDGSGRVVAAISVTNLESIMPPGALEGRVRAAVLRAAGQISARLGAVRAQAA